MERYEIEAFLTLAEELHLGRTAVRLRVTTARVSQVIGALERRVGAPLFERTSRSVVLTPIGRRLHDDLRPAVERVEAAFAAAVAAGRAVSGVLRVGFVGAAAGPLMDEVTGSFGARHPGCEVLARRVGMDEALRRLRADELDVLVACLPLTGPDLANGPVLLSEPRLLAVPVGHPLARRGSVSVEDLARAEVLRSPYSLPGGRREGGPARQQGGTREGAGTGAAGAGTGAAGTRAGTVEEVLTLVGAGHGVFPLAAHAVRAHARSDVAFVPFHDAPPLEWGPVWRASRVNARIRAFAQAPPPGPGTPAGWGQRP